MAGPPDGDPPYGAIYSATWVNGSAQCVGCGDVDCNGYVTGNDVVEAYKRSANPAYPLWLPWAADVDGNGYVTGNDVVELYKRSANPAYELHCYC